VPDLSLIIKCTRSCNLACSYCLDRLSNSGSLEFENLLKLVKTTLSDQGPAKTTFIFHGGEPLTLGIAYFLKILGLQRLCGQEGQPIRNIVQTNGTLIDADWIQFLKANDIEVGISLDGPPELQDANRRYVDGRASSRDILANIERLQEAEVRFGVLCVAAKDLLNYDSGRFLGFFCERGIGRVGVLPQRPRGKTFRDAGRAEAFYETRRRYARFMCQLYRHWMELDDPKVNIRELSSVLDTIVGGRSPVCVHNGPCVGRHVGIDVDGRIAHCDKFFDDERFCFGNIDQDSISDIMASEKFARARELEAGLRSQCRSCDWFELCGGGCLYDAVLFERSGLQSRVDVCHWRLIYDFIANDLQSTLAAAAAGP